MEWNSRSENVASDSAPTDADLGYAAFTRRKAHMYKRLVSNALQNISRVGLSLPFEAL